MRSHALYAVGICAALAALIVAAPTIKNARVDATCGATTVYVTVPPAPQTVDPAQIASKATSDYKVSVTTVRASAESVADGLTNQFVSSTQQAVNSILETVLNPATVTSATILKAETTSGSYSSLGSSTDDYVFPNHGAGSASGLAAMTPALDPIIHLSDLVTSAHSIGTNTLVDANVGGKASNTGVYIVDQTLTVIPFSTVSALAGSTDQVTMPTVKNALVSSVPVAPTNLAAAATSDASSSLSEASEIDSLTTIASSGSFTSLGGDVTISYKPSMVTGSSTPSYTTLSAYFSPSVVCSSCVAPPTDTFNGAAHSGFESFPTSSSGSVEAESSPMSVTNFPSGLQPTTTNSAPTATISMTPADVSSLKTYTERDVIISQISTTSSVAVSAYASAPVAEPHSDYLVRSPTDTSAYSSPALNPSFSRYSSKLTSATLNITTSATTTRASNLEADDTSLSTTTGLSSSQSEISIVVTSILTFTTSTSTSVGLAVSGDVHLATSVSNSSTSLSFVTSRSTSSTESATAALITATTTTSFLSTSSQTQPATCTELPDFILNFDDLPPQAAFNNITAQPMPLFSPYHKFYFSGGFTIVPPPTDPYLPSSGRLLVEFLATPLSDLGTTGAIGNGRNELSGCFNFNALGLNVGCDSKGPTCDWYFSGYQYDLTSASFNQITSQNISTLACPDLTDCSLIPITLDNSFRNLTEMRVHLTVAGEDKIWWMDDLELEWFDKNCGAQQCRSKVK